MATQYTVQPDGTVQVTKTADSTPEVQTKTASDFRSEYEWLKSRRLTLLQEIQTNLQLINECEAQMGEMEPVLSQAEAAEIEHVRALQEQINQQV